MCKFADSDFYLGNTAGIISVYAFLEKDAPRYVPGYSIGIAFLCFTIISSTAYFVMCWSQNRKRQKSTHDLGLTEHEKTEMGDMSPDYRYLL